MKITRQTDVSSLSKEQIYVTLQRIFQRCREAGEPFSEEMLYISSNTKTALVQQLKRLVAFAEKIGVSTDIRSSGTNTGKLDLPDSEDAPPSPTESGGRSSRPDASDKAEKKMPADGSETAKKKQDSGKKEQSAASPPASAVPQANTSESEGWSRGKAIGIAAATAVVAVVLTLALVRAAITPANLDFESNQPRSAGNP